MHRFWAFPLILGVVGAVYPLLCVAQGMIVLTYVWGWAGLGWAMAGEQLNQVFVGLGPYGFGIGSLVGIGAAAREMARFGAGDRSGKRAMTRLMGNGWWLGCYALAFYAGTFLLGAGLMRLGVVPISVVKYGFPSVLFFGMGIVNLAAIVWAACRTALAEDVLSPRVLRAKWRDSNRVIP